MILNLFHAPLQSSQLMPKISALCGGRQAIFLLKETESHSLPYPDKSAVISATENCIDRRVSEEATCDSKNISYYRILEEY
jgi:hypothetical protein